MEQEPLALVDLIELILFLGSFTFLIGAFFQIYILYTRKIPFIRSISVVVITRIITLILALIFWVEWIFPFDVMFLFLFLPALLPELVFSPLMLKWFGVKRSDI